MRVRMAGSSSSFTTNTVRKPADSCPRRSRCCAASGRRRVIPVAAELDRDGGADARGVGAVLRSDRGGDGVGGDGGMRREVSQNGPCRPAHRGRPARLDHPFDDPPPAAMDARDQRPEQRHHGGHERHPDDERVGQDADRERQADRLDHRVRVEHEGREDARS